MAQDILYKALIIAGPTASGKSARALEIAEKHDGVIINADSMQVYDALPLLTAQPAAGDRQRAPHRLYGSLTPHEKCTAQRWSTLAAEEIRKAHAENKYPVITGGTGFYIKALTEGLSPIPEIDPAVRQAANLLQQELGNPAFHAELEKRDPVMAQRLHPNDTQRLIRAWEVLEATGKSLATWQAIEPEPLIRCRYDIELIMPERDDLCRRCDHRFDAMIAAGALDEVEVLDQQIREGEIAQDAPITHALGFRYLQQHLQGALTLAEAIELSKTETRQYAKRQAAWFRNQVKL